MYRDTNHFFDEVKSGNATTIDIKNYVRTITDNHSLELLKSLNFDFLCYKDYYISEIESEISTELINEKIKEYHSIGIEVPKHIYKNPINIELNKKNGNKNLNETGEQLDLEQMFYPHRLFTLNQLERYLKDLLEPMLKKERFLKNLFEFENLRDNLESYLFWIKNHEQEGILYDLELLIKTKNASLKELINQKENETKSNELKSNLYIEINELFQEVLRISNQSNFYFDFCTSSIYSDNYNERLKDHIEIEIDTNEVEFIKKELKKIKYNYERTKKHEYWNNLNLNYLKTSTEKKIDFLIRKCELKGVTLEVNEKTYFDFLDNAYNSQIQIKNNKHDNIFSNNGFVLFEYILKNFINSDKGRYEDLSYYYRRLFQDKYIHQKSAPFKEWFEDNYDESFSKIKTEYQTKKPQRFNNYLIALEWFKSQ